MNENQNNIYIVTEDDSGQRLDVFLSAFYPDVSRSFIQKRIKDSDVLVNDITQKASYIIRINDIIKVNFSEQSNVFENLKPENIPIDVLYEDEQMAIVYKPSNMLTHPTSKELTNTLVNALLYKFDKLSNCNGTDRPGIVHRLDRNTSGLLMIAKTNEAYNFLKEKMQSHSIEKKYCAIVSGIVKDDFGIITTNIARHPSKPEKMTVSDIGKYAETHYKVIERFEKHTLLEINLITGRTHQIRVHMSHIKHPIINDTLYGGSKLPVKTNEQALQSFSIKFISPFDNKEHIVEIDYDDDIIKLINYLRSKK